MRISWGGEFHRINWEVKASEGRQGTAEKADLPFSHNTISDSSGRRRAL